MIGVALTGLYVSVGCRNLYDDVVIRVLPFVSAPWC